MSIMIDSSSRRRKVYPPEGLAARGQVNGRGPSLAMGGIYLQGDMSFRRRTKQNSDYDD